MLFMFFSARCAGEGRLSPSLGVESQAANIVTWLVRTAKTELVGCCFYHEFQMGLGQPHMTRLYGHSWTHSLSCSPGVSPLLALSEHVGRPAAVKVLVLHRPARLSPLYQNPLHRGEGQVHRLGFREGSPLSWSPASRLPRVGMQNSTAQCPEKPGNQMFAHQMFTKQVQLPPLNSG